MLKSEYPSPDLETARRTIAPHGMTGPEIERFSGAVQFMENNCATSASLWWITTNKGTSRPFIADVQKRITRLQRKYRVRPYNATTFETRGGMHAHITFIGNPEIVRDLRGAAAFADLIKVAPVPDPQRLARQYLAKERTPQAGYGRERALGGRIGGSHRLAGGGDRVRLSRDLERDAISAGYVEDWQHSNARRTDKRKGYRLRGAGPLARAPRLAGQLPLLVELNRPVARLREFGGGIVPAPVALEIEFQRRQRGLSQRQLAGMIGRSQGQYANAIRGHDPMSSSAVNRLRELLLA